MTRLAIKFPLVFCLAGTAVVPAAEESEQRNAAEQFAQVRELVKKYCLQCHATDVQEGELDLERFQAVDDVRKDVKPWSALIVQVEAGEMPPKDKPQPTPEQRQLLVAWTKNFLASEARARAGDPGSNPLHRLSNTEYNNTVRDLTGVDLQPARDFPADGAAGEGFTNAAEALTMSPALMSKYMNAAKDIAAHVELLPDGFRFSPTKTRRDWTDESLSRLRAFYSQFTADGNLPVRPYVAALAKYRDELRTEKISVDGIAEQEKLSPKYLRLLWQTLEAQNTRFPLQRISQQWQESAGKDVDAVVQEVAAWQSALWTFGKIGSYRNESRQLPQQPSVAISQRLEFRPEITPGQNEVTVHLQARRLIGGDKEYVEWHLPRLESKDGKTLLLRDYQKFGARFEVDYAVLFDKTENYLAAVIEAANDPQIKLDQLASKSQLDEAWLKRWMHVLAISPRNADREQPPGKEVPAVAWKLLTDKHVDPQRPAIAGWKAKGAELPIVVANNSEDVLQIPGRVSPHGVAVHPMPEEVVAVRWTSPIAGTINVAAKVQHAHPTCGNGVAWWLEKQTPARAFVLANGAVELGKEHVVQPMKLQVEVGDAVILGIDAKASNHFCDLTEITFAVSEAGVEKSRSWDLATDVSRTLLAGNPHADEIGNENVWSFVSGSAKDRRLESGSAIDANSILSRWRQAAESSTGRKDADELAKQLHALLIGTRPGDDRTLDQKVYDFLLSADGLLPADVDVVRLSPTRSNLHFGIAPERFGDQPQGHSVDANSLVAPVDEVLSVRLPARLFQEYQFVVDGRLAENAQESVVQFRVLPTKPQGTTKWNDLAAIVAQPDQAGHRQLLAGLAEFRQIFPVHVCFPHIIPVDEVVCLKSFHREDEPLERLFLNEKQQAELEHLWQEHRFITHSPVVENEYFPLFIGFVTQDQPKETLAYFEAKRPEFKQRAEEFEQDFEAAAQPQLVQLMDFAARAYRRPLADSEEQELRDLYQSLRAKNMLHEEAFRSVVARVLISPSFLLHLEHAPPGTAAQEITDWELANRLSYFLWSSLPDDELRQLAAAGKLHQPETLTAQTKRMLQDPRVRSLAIEFGTQWIHVRGFDNYQDKNEKLFPTFDSSLRHSMYEEATLFFQDMFQNNRAVENLLSADYTFVNQRLAEHYGIPNVQGDQFRRVDGVQKFGRGGLLGFATVLTKQAGASRTSPVLRGNWIVETLLGEKLPKPPANVPQLPESNLDTGLTMRQIVEQHVSASECAVCHRRIDPFGLTLEKYDAIGRLREKDESGLLLDTSTQLRDGTALDGMAGLRDYLISNKREVVARLFYQRLVGYALGRSVNLSDQNLIDQMLTDSEAGTLQAILKIVHSPQFRMIRGSDFAEP